MRVAVGCYFTPEYAGYFPGWLESVRALTRPPDDVVAVTRSRVPKGVRRVAPPPGAFSFSGWRNALADACTDVDYLVSVDIDDRYLPGALDGCDDWSTDVVAYGMRYTAGDGLVREWLPRPERDAVAQASSNLVPEGSPIRVSLFDRVRWDDRWMPYADWAFWVEAARAGASFSATGRIDFDYRWHADSPTDETNIRALLRSTA